MRKLLVLWLIGWAVFGFPWGTFTPHPRFSRVSVVPFRWSRRRDQILNFAYYVPFGLIGGLLGWPARVVMVSGAALSAVTEFVQVFSTERVPSATDLFLNTAGVIVGVAVVIFVRTRSRRLNEGM